MSASGLKLWKAAVLFPGILALLPATATAQVASGESSPLSRLTKISDRLRPGPLLEPVEDVQKALPRAVADSWGTLRLDHGEWRGYVDRRSSYLQAAEGEGIPWIPGTGNRLTRADLASLLGAKDRAGLTTLETLARRFVEEHRDLLGIDASSLRLNPGRSGPVSDHLWWLDFDVVRDGMSLEGARVVFRVGHGNLIQFGAENLPPPGLALPPVDIPKEKAWAALAQYVGDFYPVTDRMVDSGSLHLLPAAVPADRFDAGLGVGQGYELAIVWQFSFRRDGVVGTWQGRVDASTGEVLEFLDVNEYAQAAGGVYLTHPTGTEVVRPMPFANLSSGGFANSAGVYPNPSAPITSTLNGQFVRIVDSCGAISLNSVAGNLTFGTSGGNDCTTPGVGGNGNTHATRTQFYHVNRAKEAGRGWLPGNAWLNAQLTTNVNINQVCNAYWDGATLNFFRSGTLNNVNLCGTTFNWDCNNTGQNPGVSIHEFGHGLDQNDGSGAELGSGEAYADVTAAIALHNSCIGYGFHRNAANCSGYGDACTACTGVRDIDWAKHSSNTAHTVNNFTRPRCCAGTGPCGREVHCEAYVPAEAVWDFANRDLPSPGTGSAWATLDRLWYLSRATSTRAFTCVTGATFTSNGCNAGSWWRTMRAVDDDDGNLANGTPHSCNLFAAFNRHGIACTTDAGANTCFRGCTPPAIPTLTTTPGTNQVTLSWTSAGAGRVYDVYRNDVGCNAGFVKIANDLTATSLVDTGVANNLTYYYQVVAHPAGNEACSADPTTCRSVQPLPPGIQVSFNCTGNVRFSSQITCTAIPLSLCGPPYTYTWSYHGTATSFTSSGASGFANYNSPGCGAMGFAANYFDVTVTNTCGESQFATIGSLPCN